MSRPSGAREPARIICFVTPDSLKFMFDRMVARSWRNHQLLDIEQQKVGVSGLLSGCRHR